jgi:hypothetical protein
MAIDISAEQLITPAQYTRMRPPGRNGRPMNIATAYRHIFQGVRGVRLEHVKIGGGTYTSIEAVQRFVERLTQVRDGASPADATLRTPAARQKALTKANLELDKLGV